MEKEAVLQRIEAGGLVVVIRAGSVDEARRIAGACLEGGAAGIELAFTIPGAHKLLEELARDCGLWKNAVLGAGTVLDPETARIAILSGARFVVSPCVDGRTIRLCNRYRIPAMPGAASIRDVVEALELGVDIVKIFPGELYGPSILKAFQGPLPQARFMPTGGVTLENAADWIRAGAVAVGVGGSLTAAAKNGGYAKITAETKRFREAIAAARGEARSSGL